MKPPAPIVKSITENSVSNTRLSVRMKTRSRCPNQAKSPCPKASIISENGSKVSNEVLSRQVKSGARPLSATWSSVHSFRDAGNLAALKHLNVNIIELEKPSKPSNNCDETYAVKEPLKPKVNNVNKIFKTTDKPKLNINSSQHFVQLLKKKDLEIIALKKKVETLGQSVSGIKPVLKSEASNSSCEMIQLLEEKLKQQNDDMKIINSKTSKLEEDLSNLRTEIALKNTELGCMKSENCKNDELIDCLLPLSSRKPDQKLEDNLFEENHEIRLLEEENLKLREIIRKQEADLADLKCRLNQVQFTAPVDSAEVQLVGDNNTDLELETAVFLEKVSDVCRNKSLKIKAQSKDKKVKISLKITVRKEKLDRISPQLSFSEVFESPGIFAKTPCQTFSVKEGEVDDSMFVDKYKLRNNPLLKGHFPADDVQLFSNPCESLLENSEILLGEASEILEPSKGFNGNDLVGSERFGVNVNDNYRASLGTLDRAENLDMKLQEMWTRLSSQGDTLEQLKSEKRRFTFSVDLLEEELSESRTQHRNLVEQVNVAKKLFY